MVAADTTLLKREFRAMGTEMSLLCPASRGAQRRLSLAERWLAAYEERLSRFIPYSELCRLNGSTGRPFHASPLLFDFVRLCLELAHRSDGVFDPTLLPELKAAGYDRTFDHIPTLSGSSLCPRPRGQPRAQARPIGFRDIDLDVSTRTITLPEGVGIDSAGLGKGWAADRVARILAGPCLVDAGGDIAARGAPPDSPAWYVGIQDPFQPEEDWGVLGIIDRGVATSSVLKRRWLTPSGPAHHLIDARSGLPSLTDAVAVTVVAEDATLADFHAKVALLKGVDAGLSYLEDELRVEGLVFSADGRATVTRGL